MALTLHLELVIPANTTKANAKRVTRRLPAGVVVTSVRLYVPSGHQSLQPVWFEHRKAKILPTDGGEIALDNVPGQELLPPGAELSFPQEGDLEFVGYNSDAVNEHTTRAIVTGFYPEEARRRP